MGMSFTPVDLERSLVNNARIWCQDMLFKNPQDNGAVPVGLSVYQGHIPSYQAGPRGTATAPKAPSLAIKTVNFSYERLKGHAVVRFMIVTWDNDLSRRGYIDCANVLNRLVYGLFETVVIDQSFVLTDAPVHGEMIEEPHVDYFPYFLGTIEAQFGIMTPGPGWQPPGVLGYTDTGVYNDTGSDTLKVIAPNTPGWSDPGH